MTLQELDDCEELSELRDDLKSARRCCASMRRQIKHLKHKQVDKPLPIPPKDGFKLEKGKYRSACKISVGDHKNISNWIGDYNLKYDPQQKLYYVEHQ